MVSNSGNSLSADVLAGIINIEYGVRVMSEVKRYELCGLGNGFYTMMEAPDGDFYKREDYAALQQKLDEATLECNVIRDQIKYWNDKCRAVTAENVALKEFIKECSVIQGEGNWTSDTEKSVYVPAEDWIPASPATDAIINELRAEGIKEFCALLKSYGKVEPYNFDPLFADLYAKINKRIYESILDNPIVYDLASLVDWLESGANDSRAYADMAIKHAAQLRTAGQADKDGE